MLEQLRKERDLAEREYLEERSAEAWADYLELSVRVAILEKEQAEA